jgi:putative addiction module killer protein
VPETDIEVVEYVNEAGKNAFALWMAKLDIKAFAKVAAAVARMRLNNFGDVKPVGRGVRERRINFGPGYRIYFGRDGQKLVILLGGGTKSRQDQDIRNAQGAWQEYRQRKQKESDDGTD